MTMQTFPAGDTPRVTITGCHGALRIEFWDQRDFAVQPGHLDSALSHEDAGLVIHEARGDMLLRVPAAAEIAVEAHTGDLHIATIDGSVRLRDIDGRVFVSGAGTLTIERDELLRHRKWAPLHPRRNVEAREIGAADLAEVHGSLLLVAAG